MDFDQLRDERMRLRDEKDALETQILGLQRKLETQTATLEGVERELDAYRHTVVYAICKGTALDNLPPSAFETPFSRADLERLASLGVYFQPNRGSMFVGSQDRRVPSQTLKATSEAAHFLSREASRLRQMRGLK